MIIRRLTSKEIQLAKAATVVSKDKKTLYYNLRHGTYGRGLYKWWCSFSTKFFVPENVTDTLVLEDDDYIIVPIKDNKNGGLKRASNGDVCYTITKDDMEYHKSDILLLWEIPNKNYINVDYEIEGSGEQIGRGVTGKQRGDVMCRSTAPVLEITGDVTLTWEAKDINGKRFKQVIVYDSSVNSWDIQPIKELKE